MSKQFNRFQEWKALKKAISIVKGWGLSDIEDIDKCSRRIKNNRHPCSCHMCRNPRTSSYSKGKEKLTIQERKNLDERGGDSDVISGME